jgi:ribosome biogenesis ATPase
LRDVARDSRADGFSGADLAQLHLIAGHAALKRELEEENELVRGIRTEVRYGLQGVDWQVALDKVKPSVRDMGLYRQSRSQGLWRKYRFSLFCLLASPTLFSEGEK